MITHVEEGPLIPEILFIRNKRERYLKEVSANYAKALKL